MNKNSIKNIKRDSLKGKSEIFIDSLPEELNYLEGIGFLLVKFTSVLDYFVLCDDRIMLSINQSSLEIYYSEIHQVNFDIFTNERTIKRKFKVEFLTEFIQFEIYLYGDDYPYWINIFKTIFRNTDTEIKLKEQRHSSSPTDK